MYLTPWLLTEVIKVVGRQDWPEWPGSQANWYWLAEVISSKQLTQFKDI